MSPSKTPAFSLVVLAALVMGGCGGKDHEIAVSFSGNTAAFSDASVVDFVFVVTNVPSGGKTLDLDGNGDPDEFVFPESCGSTAPAACGYAKGQQSEITLGAFPLGYQYKIEVLLRDSSGDTVESGSTTFSNSKDTATVVIPL